MILSYRKNRLSTLAIAFAIVLLAGIVYAVAVGVLTFDATVNLKNELKLRIYDEDYDVTASSAASEGTITVSQDGQTATITGKIKAPGDKAVFTFSVENNGLVKAEIVALADTADAPLKLSGTYTDLDGLTVDAGDDADPGDPVKTIIVEWEKGPNDTADGDFTFEITLDYDPA